MSAMLAVGMISGTSVDAIDIAAIESDGERIESLGPTFEGAYRDETRRAILALVARGGDDKVEWARLAPEIARDHAAALADFLAQSPRKPDLVAFHGQTVLHRPKARLTVQLGDAQLLADLTGLEVVGDLRQADIAAGGQGAPFAPAWHLALARKAVLPRPCAFINIGGVANITFIGADDRLIAFDVGPGNALLDDWLRAHEASEIDENGRFSSKGAVDEARISKALEQPYFSAPWPKSLDRNAFSLDMATGLRLEDGAATLAAFTAAAIAKNIALLPEAPELYAICGGGRCNPTLMRLLNERLEAPARPAEDFGFDGDAMEAQAMAYLGVRSLRGLPLSWPDTTGVPEALTGGRLYKPQA